MKTSKPDMINKAAIFDMDGLLIDTDRIWRDAEQEVFSSVGIDVTDESAMVTRHMTVSEATLYRFNLQPWTGTGLREIESAVIKKVMDDINAAGCPLPGVQHILDFFLSRNFRIGLATNAPAEIAQQVLAKLGVTHQFHATCSSDFVPKGKPAPDIYLYTARKLQVLPENCIAFEDSPSGLAAAKTAGMHAVAISDKVDLAAQPFRMADIRLRSLEEFDERMLEQLM